MTDPQNPPAVPTDPPADPPTPPQEPPTPPQEPPTPPPSSGHEARFSAIEKTLETLTGMVSKIMPKEDVPPTRKPWPYRGGRRQ